MDELRRFATNAQALVAEGYYRTGWNAAPAPSFMDVLGSPDQPSDVIAEIKFSSPAGRGGKSPEDFATILDGVVAARPLGLSILAEPRVFGGRLDFLVHASTRGLPLLMKDIVVDPVQVEAAASVGSSAVLIIQTLFTRSLVEGSSQEFIDAAHAQDLDVVLEVHSLQDWDAAVETDADILGINNRDLSTMELDLSTTSSLLSSRPKDRPVVAMSGIERRSDADAMRHAGADAVLVGSSIMRDFNPGRKLSELIHG